MLEGVEGRGKLELVWRPGLTNKYPGSIYNSALVWDRRLFLPPLLRQVRHLPTPVLIFHFESAITASQSRLLKLETRLQGR